MPRGRHIAKRVIAPDPIYHSELVAKFINFIMERGKKSVAERIVYHAFETIKEKKSAQDARLPDGQGSTPKDGQAAPVGNDPLKIFEAAIDTVRPQVEVRSRRVGGANYQVPLPVPPGRQHALAFRWIIGAARARKGAGMDQKLAAELMDILSGTGGALKKKDDVHRMAEANKAFAHFARFRRK